MQTSLNGLKFIAGFEGFVPVPADDPAGNCTVGYGDKLHDGTCTPEELATLPITEAEGLARLAQRVKDFEAVVNQVPGVTTQGQYDALVSFDYNTGVSVTTLASIVRNGINQILQYIHGNDGVEYPGLIRRRWAEIALYFSTEEDMTTDETNALIDQRFAADIYPKIGSVLDQEGKLGSALTTLGNAFIQHVATHPGGGATVTMANDLAAAQAMIAALETETADLEAKVKAIGAAANG